MGNIGKNYAGIDLGTIQNRKVKGRHLINMKQNIRNLFGGQGDIRHKFRAPVFKCYKFSVKRVGVS